MSLAMSRAEFERRANAAEETRKAVQSALTNEMITRKRVELLESLVARSFWGRLRWLLTGN